MRSRSNPLPVLLAALAWAPLLVMLSLLALSALLLAPQPARAQAAPAAAPSPVGELMEAALRGETAPLERAIADPATSADLRGLLRAALAAGRLDPAAARDPVVRRLAAGRDADL